MRKLASIRRIYNIVPIDDADNIEVAIIDGWQVVVKKGDFKAGDLCVYCEIDSVLPKHPEFGFMEARKWRVRTIRLRGVLSQGICFPLSILKTPFVEELKEGDDITATLGVTKYELPESVSMGGERLGNFPACIPKTDEERVQNLKSLLEKYKGVNCYMTEKLEGTSMTVYNWSGEFGVCSRKYILKEDENNIYWKTAKANLLQEKLKFIGELAVQGELIGKGVSGAMKNYYQYVTGTDFYAFNVFDIGSGKFLGYLDFVHFCKTLGIKPVPVIAYDFALEDSIEKYLELADGWSVINPLKLREGIVVRPTEEITDFKFGRVSFKAVSNKFLLENKL